MNTLSFIESVQAFKASVQASMKRHNLVLSARVYDLFSYIDRALNTWGEDGDLIAVNDLYLYILDARVALEKDKKALKRLAYIGDRGALEQAVRTDTNAFMGARGNKFVDGLRYVLEEMLDGILENRLPALGLSVSQKNMEALWDGLALLEERGATNNLTTILNLAELLAQFEKAIPYMRQVPPRHVDEFLKPFIDYDYKELIKMVRDDYENYNLYEQIGDFMSWVGAIAWRAPESMLPVGWYISNAMDLLQEIILADQEEPLIDELVQYTDHAHDTIEEWLQDERSLDNNETDLTPLLEEYYYSVEGVYPEYMSYAVDAVDQGICPNIFDAVAWIQSNMIGVYESTTDYSQHVLDEMENPDNLPLIKAEDYWERELRYDISVLENDSIKLLLVRS